VRAAWKQRPATGLPSAAIVAIAAGAAVRASSFLAAALLAAATILGCSPAPPSTTLPPVARLSILLPPDAPIALDTGRPALAISRRGDRIVYVARREDGTLLYVRPLEKQEAIPLPGTQGGGEPFLSPQGDHVAFFAGGALRVLSLGSLEVKTLCDTPGGAAGGVWGGDDAIYFATGGGMYRVSFEGGTPERLGPPIPAGGAALWPDLAPGDRTIVFALRAGAPETSAWSLAALDLARGEVGTLVEGPRHGRVVAPGYLLYGRDATLLGAPLDPSKPALRGRAVPVQEGVLTDPRTGVAQFAVSDNGTLIYAPADPAAAERALVWVDRDGRETPAVPARRPYELPHVGPDGRRLLVSIPRGDTLLTWILEPGRDDFRPLPFEGSSGLGMFAPDGRSIIYVAPRAGAWNLFRRPIDGRADPELLMTSEYPLSPSGFSPDGRLLAVTEVARETQGDIIVLPLAGEPGRSPRPYLRTAADEWGAVFSRDGRFLAYASNASGRNEVYLSHWPDPGEPIRVSDGGGYGPIWAPDGGTLYFRRGDAVLATPLRRAPASDGGRAAAPLFGSASILFRGPYEGGSAGWPNYDLAPDGRRFLMVRRKEGDSGTRRLDAVIGFNEELRRAVAKGQEE
jgi:Tol biopolymer transport system component